MHGFHEIIDLSGREHSFRLLSHHKTSFRGIALVLGAAIFLVYSFSI
jgi:hypothetical protein